MIKQSLLYKCDLMAILSKPCKYMVICGQSKRKGVAGRCMQAWQYLHKATLLCSHFWHIKCRPTFSKKKKKIVHYAVDELESVHGRHHNTTTQQYTSIQPFLYKQYMGTCEQTIFYKFMRQGRGGMVSGCCTHIQSHLVMLGHFSHIMERQFCPKKKHQLSPQIFPSTKQYHNRITSKLIHPTKHTKT